MDLINFNFSTSSMHLGGSSAHVQLSMMNTLYHTCVLGALGYDEVIDQLKLELIPIFTKATHHHDEPSTTTTTTTRGTTHLSCTETLLYVVWIKLKLT